MPKIFGIKHHKLKTYIFVTKKKEKEFEIRLVECFAQDLNFLIPRLPLQAFNCLQYYFFSLAHHTQRLYRNEIKHHLFIATPTKVMHLSAANLSHE